MSFKEIFNDVSNTVNELFGEICSIYLVDRYDETANLLLPSINVIVDKSKEVKSEFGVVIDYEISAKVLKLDLPMPHRGVALLQTSDGHVYELGSVTEQNKSAHWFRCSETSTRFPTDLAPTPSFTYSKVGKLVTFVNTTISDNIKEYSWSFGDGNESIGIDGLHEYANDGTYAVVLTATSTTDYTNSIIAEVVVSSNGN